MPRYCERNLPSPYDSEPNPRRKVRWSSPMWISSADVRRRGDWWTNGMTFRQTGRLASRARREGNDQPCDERGERDDLEHRADADDARDRAAQGRSDDPADIEAHVVDAGGEADVTSFTAELRDVRGARGSKDPARQAEHDEDRSDDEHRVRER